MMKRITGVVVLGLCVCTVRAQQPQVRHQRQEARQEARQEQASARREHRQGDAGAQELQQTRKYAGAHLHLEHAGYNFGDVERKGGDLVHNFRFENDGSAPLVITRVVTSCSCLKAAFPKRPVPPGGTAVIRMTYEPHKSDPGTFHKVVQVYSNSVEGREIITVQGNSLDATKM